MNVSSESEEEHQIIITNDMIVSDGELNECDEIE